MKKITVLFMVVALLLVSVSTAFAVSGTPSVPVSSAGVTPYIIPGANQGGNRTCAEVGMAYFGNANYYQFSSDRVNYVDGAFTGSFPAGLSVMTDGSWVSWSASFGIGAVIVKGGSDANVYVYEPQRKSDSGLAAPVAGGSKTATLSNITFCWNPEEVKVSQWCSPGYWRQTQHLGSWAATGYSPTTKFFAAFGYYPKVSKSAIKAGAPTDPTLWQVLQKPQWYGGAAFNKVGDLLSYAHPDVNFTGVRTPDSCPLGRAVVK